MRIKDALEQILDIKQEINELREEQKDLLQSCYGNKSSSYDGEIIRDSETHDSTANLAMKLESMDSMLKSKIKKLQETLNYAEYMLSYLDSRGRRILRLYYYKNLTDQRIAMITHYCDGHYIGILRRKYLCRLMAIEREERERQ